MEKSLLDQDRASEQIHCENNRLKEEMERLNKKIANIEPVQKELEKLADAMCCNTSLCIFTFLDQNNTLHC